jgi:DNA-binding transcriptional LysR family regulator
VGRALPSRNFVKTILAIGRFPELPDDCTTARLFEETYLVVACLDHPWIRQKLDLGTYLRAAAF